MAKMNRHVSRFRPLIILAVFFVGAIAGFFGENGALESASSVTRIDVLREWARVLKILRPLLSQESFSSFRMPPFSDYPGEQDEMIVSVLGAGLMQGFADGRFQPERRMNRGEGVLAAGRLEEFIRASLRNTPKKRECRPAFSDIVDGHWLFDSMSRLGGIGALSSFGEGAFHPDQPLTGAELRSIGMSIIDYYGQDVAVIESTPEGLAVSLKAAIGELSTRDFRYCWAGGVWRMMPESGIVPWEERKSGGLLHIAAAEWTVTPTDVVPLKGHVWFAAVRRNTGEVIRDRRGAGTGDAADTPPLHLNETDEHTRKRLEAHLNALRARLHRSAIASEDVSVGCTAAPRIPDTEIAFAGVIPEQPAMPAPEMKPLGQEPAQDTAVPILNEPVPPPAPVPLPEVESHVVREKPPVAAKPTASGEAGVIQVTGCLLDSLNRRPIGGATVLVGTRDITTEKDGTFRFQIRKDALIEVTAYAEGYEALTLKYRAGFRNAPLVLQLRPVLVSFVGTVLDAETGAPVAGARVKFGSQSVITSSTGQFRIPKVAATYHQISCSAPGYMETFEIAYADPDGKAYAVKMRPIVSTEIQTDMPQSSELLYSETPDAMVVPDE